MRIQPHFLDEIRARLPVSQVVGRKVALKKKGREFAGLSPFKVEKTPSFFVNDQKGFYHCFASGEHGDIFTFLMKTEGLDFPEAVERLAGEAGLEMPKATVQDEAREDERQRLYRLVETSAVFFESELRAPQGREARDYLERRGLSREILKTFRIGFASANRTALKQHLTTEGFTVADMVASGMLIGGEDIPSPYDRFRNRVIFPITDPKGRVIAFGGRALDPGQPAKYLNSPETPLFHKGHILFNAALARTPAYEKQRIIAVEGYMDVIALTQAGFKETVAPLGTALTPQQVQLLWRVTPEPILCFDGDSAGRKAAYRAIDTVLPHLKAGSSLSFAFLDDGLDPDDLVRQSGPEAFENVLSRARPLVDVLFDREWNSGEWTTPERRARLEVQIKTLTDRIADSSIKNHYEREMRGRLFEKWRASRQGNAGRFTASRAPTDARNGASPRPSGGAYGGQNAQQASNRRSFNPAPNIAPHAEASDSLRNSGLAAAGTGASLPPREALIARTLINHPWLVDDHAECIAALELTSSAARKLRDAILSAQALENSLDRTIIRFHLDQLGLGDLADRIAHSRSHRCDKFAEPEAEIAEVEAGWEHLMRLHDQQVGLAHSLKDAELAFHEDGSEQALARIAEIKTKLVRTQDDGSNTR